MGASQASWASCDARNHRGHGGARLVTLVVDAGPGRGTTGPGPLVGGSELGLREGSGLLGLCTWSGEAAALLTDPILPVLPCLLPLERFLHSPGPKPPNFPRTQLCKHSNPCWMKLSWGLSIDLHRMGRGSTGLGPAAPTTRTSGCPQPLQDPAFACQWATRKDGGRARHGWGQGRRAQQRSQADRCWGFPRTLPTQLISDSPSLVGNHSPGERGD